jgi:aminoglycoside phosphotransferase (APT) family kinase protein
MICFIGPRPWAQSRPVATELTATVKPALDGVMTEDESIERFAAALGLAALDLWSTLPQEIQQNLFEQAVLRGHKTERDESLREQLAQFLHDHHERTIKRNAGQAGAV